MTPRHLLLPGLLLAACASGAAAAATKTITLP